MDRDGDAARLPSEGGTAANDDLDETAHPTSSFCRSSVLTYSHFDLLLRRRERLMRTKLRHLTTTSMDLPGYLSPHELRRRDYY